MSPAPAPPVFVDTKAYAAALADATFWLPYVVAVLEKHGLEVGELQAGFTGSYPVVMNDGVVVKLFGHFGAWSSSYSAEVAALRAVTIDHAVAAPAIVATGSLYAQPAAPWPYLVLERIAGVAWRAAELTPAAGQRIAIELGRQLQRTHRAVVDASALHPDWLAGHAAATTLRHRHWRTHP